MQTTKMIVLASAFVAGSILAASAQTTAPSSGAGMNAGVSAATHCKDAQGHVQLKSAAAKPDSSTQASGSSSMGSSTTGTGTSGMSGSGSTSGSAGSTAGSVAATLPSC